MSPDHITMFWLVMVLLVSAEAASMGLHTDISTDGISEEIDVLLKLLENKETDTGSERSVHGEQERAQTRTTDGVFCHGTTFLTTSGLTIHSTNFPQGYGDNLNCEWLIEAGPNQLVEITFNGRVRIEGDAGNCIFDYLDIYDGASTGATKLISLCGNQQTVPSITTTGNQAFLKFKTDGSLSYKGFELTYTFQNTQHPPTALGGGDVCSGITELTSSSGTVTSPSYPNNYGDFSSCGFRITAPAGNLIEVTFTDFALEPETSCMFDAVTLYNGDNDDDPEIGRYCGTNSPGIVTSSGNELFIKFVSDLSLNYRGFSFDYTFKEDDSAQKESPACGSDKPQILTGEQGSFSTDGHHDKLNYADNLDCAWRVVVPATMRAHLMFESFSLEPGYMCQYDKVLIYDGADATSEPLGPYCGGEMPGDITATGNVLYIVFQTDGSVTAPGFEAKFSGKNKISSGGGGGGGGQCGVPSVEPKFGRIVGGQVAVPHSWPWQFSMRYRNYPTANGWGHWCGGSIIAQRWVVTAAHCVYGKDNPADFHVVVGDHNRRTDSEASQLIISLDEIIIHELYDDQSYDNDIALFKLSSELTYTAEVSPVCLPRADIPSRTVCVTTGWGDTQGTADSTYLQQVQVPTIEANVCNQVGWYGGAITTNMMCAGYPEGVKDSCQGDSGGPLVCASAGQWKLYGITSWGNGCAKEKNPGVYSRVTRYINWIESKTGVRPA